MTIVRCGLIPSAVGIFLLALIPAQPQGDGGGSDKDMWCSLPKQVIQHEVKKSSDIVKVKGTVKLTDLENSPPLANAPLVACPIYNQKGVHPLNMCRTSKMDREKEGGIWQGLSFHEDWLFS